MSCEIIGDSFTGSEAIIKVAGKKIHSLSEAFVKGEIEEWLPAALERLGIDEEWRETLVDKVAPLAGEFAGEVFSNIGVPLLSAVLKRAKDTSVKLEVRKGVERMVAGLERVERRISSLERQIEDRFRGLSEHLFL